MNEQEAEEYPEERSAASGTESSASVTGSKAEAPRRRGSRSKRRMTLLRRFAYWIGVPIGMLLIRFFWHTCRIVHVEGRSNIEDRLLKRDTAVICYWHRHQLFCWRYLRQLIDRGARVGWLISASAHVTNWPGFLVLSGIQTRRWANTGLTICRRASLSARPGL